MEAFNRSDKIPETILRATRAVAEKELNRPVTDDEVKDIAEFLCFMAELAFDQAIADQALQEKLQEFPQGFQLEGRTYRCEICGDHVTGENSWYDQGGIKCRLCQQAIYRKLIPASLAKDKDSYYSETCLWLYFKLDKKAINQWVKQGLLHARITPKENGKGKHYRLFLHSDNEDFLPPKSLLAAGPEANNPYPWYFYPHIIGKIQKYGICEYLRFTEETN